MNYDSLLLGLWNCFTHLKEKGIHKLDLILEWAFIGGTRLKEGGRLLEPLP